jgi:hypothetical protein
LLRIVTGDAIFAEATAAFDFDPSRFDIVRWRQVIRTRASQAAEGERLNFSWQAPGCDQTWGPRVVTLRTYYVLRGGRWVPSRRTLPDHGPVPDLNQIIDPSVSDAEIMGMLDYAGACANSLA